MPQINFFNEDTSYTLKNKRIIRGWLETVIDDYSLQIDALNFIYCSDNYLLKVNQDYLEHDYYTDIITFDHRDSKDEPINSDIFISIDRVKENAHHLNTSTEQELFRVMIHGVLHLIGFKDSTDDEKHEMRKREEACLSLLNI